jgi:CYTH domain-containing protein
VQTVLNERMIEGGVLFAAGHEREASHIREHSPGAVLAIKTQHGTLLRKVVGSRIPTNDAEPLLQFLPISPIARGAPNEPSQWNV